VRFFRKESVSPGIAAEQALALNPMDGGTLALMVRLMAHIRATGSRAALRERAAQLNPRHPDGIGFRSSTTHIARTITPRR
jgi:hypothetical protein